MNKTIIDDISKRLAEAIPEGVKAVKQDIENNFRSILQSVFAKLDLVTREEFDVQVKVLQRTRKLLTELEKKIVLLEAQLREKELNK